MAVRSMLALSVGLALAAFAAQAQPRPMSDDDVRRQIILESIRSNGGYCVCPWQKDHKGKVCGVRAIYNRPGGVPPQCYMHEVDQNGVDAWRNEHR